MIKNAQQIREAAPILDVVRQYATNLELKKAGSNYTACCPFHAEKTPSFSINPAKNIYKCFGCGVGGDAVAFLMENNGMTYPEALQAAAQVARVEVEYENDANWQERKAEIEEERKEKDVLWFYLKSIHDVLEQYTHRHLSERCDQINIFGRVYSLETLRAFQISIAPTRSEFNEMAIAHSWDTYLLKQLGLFTDAEKPRFIFADRMLFPIFTHLGKVTGLAGRKAPEDDNKKNPKYLNSKESLIFNKSELLYGLHQAKRAIRQEDHAILVEGYTDVMTLYDYGMQNAVASCGTAFTDQQAKLLKRFTKRVVLLRDGDEAGIKAAKRDLEILLANGFEVKIMLLPEGEDPDSYVRKYGVEEENGLRTLELLDAVIWRVMIDFDKHDVFNREMTFDLTGRLLSLIDNENIRNAYLNDLCTAKMIGRVKTDIQERIQDHRRRKYDKQREFSEDQETDVQRYGLFVEKNKYFACSGTREDAFAITNFYVKPIMLVVGTHNSYRLVEIINERNERFITDVASDDFSEMNSFKKVIEARGNFTFLEWAKSPHYIKIKRKVFDQMRQCYQVLTLGWQREGFFAWSNGITDNEGKFYEVDEYGVVSHEGKQYYLPAFSKINTDLRNEDDTESYAFHKFYCYTKGNCPSFEEWTNKVTRVFLKNGVIGIGFYLTACYRSSIKEYLGIKLPHLNLFGPTGAGKTQLSTALGAMFGLERTGFNLENNTRTALYRRASQMRDGLQQMEEYSNKVQYRIIEAMKDWYDGGGRETGNTNNTIDTQITRVKSTAIMAGQQRPTKDVALLNRCITLNCPNRSYTDEDKNAYDDLMNICKSGVLTQITSELQQYRELIAAEIVTAFKEVKHDLKTRLKDYDLKVLERMMDSYSLTIAVTKILMSKLKFAFSYEEMMQISIECLIDQVQVIAKEDEVSSFWKMVEYLLDNNHIRYEKDVLVEYHSQLTLINEINRRETYTRQFDMNTKLLFIRFTSVHPLYSEHLRKQGGEPFTESEIIYYLQQSEGYVGKTKAKKFGKKACRCFIFEVENLPFDLLTTKEYFERQSPFESGEDHTTETPKKTPITQQPKLAF